MNGSQDYQRENQRPAQSARAIFGIQSGRGMEARKMFNRYMKQQSRRLREFEVMKKTFKEMKKEVRILGSETLVLFGAMLIALIPFCLLIDATNNRYLIGILFGFGSFVVFFGCFKWFFNIHQLVKEEQKCTTRMQA